MRYPRNLKLGDYIGTTAPSAGLTKQIDYDRLENAKKNLKELGYNFIETKNVRTDIKGRSSSAKERASEFLELWKSDKVGAIISTSGGDFLNEILDEFDWEEIKKTDAKWFQGYSDNTGLTYLLPILADTACLYGVNIKDYGMRRLYRNLEDSLEIMKGKEIVQDSFKRCESNEWIERIDPYDEYNLSCESKWKALNNENKISFKGRAIGGCLDVIINIIGTKYDKTKEFIEKYKEDGIVWFLEVFEMSTPQIFLRLWQMKNAGYFENCKGIIFGRPLMVREDYEISYVQTLKDAFYNLDIPIIYDADIGHVSPQMSIVSGGILAVEYEKENGRIKNYFY